MRITTASSVLQAGSRLTPGPRLTGSGTPRNTLLALLVPLLVLASAGVGWSHRPPASLAETTLTGPRGPQCLRVVLANDTSGSMKSYSVARQAALAQFLAWAPGQLRPDDQIGVINFADTAAWTSTPVSPGTGSTSRPGSTSDASSTLLSPVLEAVAAAPASSCRTWLLLLSDAQLADTPATPGHARAALVDAGIDDLSLLVPDPDISVPHQWTTVFPFAAPVRFDGSNPDQSALTYGRLTADITGQHLTRTR